MRVRIQNRRWENLPLSERPDPASPTTEPVSLFKAVIVFEYVSRIRAILSATTAKSGSTVARPRPRTSIIPSFMDGYPPYRFSS